MTTLSDASTDEPKAEILRRMPAGIRAEMLVEQMLRDEDDPRMAGYFEPEGCVHHLECRRAWAEFGSATHHWKPAAVNLGGMTIEIAPSLMVERNEPVLQEHVELTITVEDRVFAKDPISCSASVTDVNELIATLQAATGNLPVLDL